MQKRHFDNRLRIEIGQRSDGSGEVCLLVTAKVPREAALRGAVKAGEFIELDSTHTYGGPRWEPGSTAAYCPILLNGDQPHVDLYSALGVGTVVELPDRRLRLFGLTVIGGRIAITSEGLEVTGAIDGKNAQASARSCLVIDAIQPGPPTRGVILPGVLLTGDL